jgi:hypothetical protein
VNALVGGVRLHQSHSLHDLHTALDTSEYCVLAIKESRGRECDEKLRAVGVGPAVGHREDLRVAERWLKTNKY